MVIETGLDIRATIGESPTWVAEERALYWIDVKAPALRRYRPDDGSNFTWPMTSDIGGFALTADMVWSGDGETLFLSHSKSREIIAFDYDENGGRISNRRIFAKIPAELGVPDGAAIDTEGGYWAALHGGGKLRRFHPDGSIDRDIDLPVSQPTMPAFAGEDLATLYLTSASDQMSAEAKAKEPMAGGLLRLDVGSRGVARPFLVR